MIRNTALLCLVLVVGCSDDPKKRGLGSTCEEDDQCESGLCYEKRCFDPIADSDEDSLENVFEIGLGMNPELQDTDLDGKLDPDELGPNRALLDTDGDGRIDAIESAIADADGDCIVDELDPDDATPDPDGCSQETVYGSCAEVAEAGLGSGTYSIDPDGDGAEEPRRIECNGLLGGGWTRLTGPWGDWLATAAPQTREYLLVEPDGRVLVPPMTDTLWSWSEAQHLTGPWFYRSAGSTTLSSFDCPPSSDGPGAGLACRDDQMITLVTAQPSGRDAGAGSIELCFTGVEDFGLCGTFAIFVRDVTCVPDEANALGDGDFSAVQPLTCWSIDTLDQGGSGLGGNVFLDTVEGSPTAPSMRAESYISPLTQAWYANLEQKEIHLAAGHGYRWLFQAKASAPRPLVFDVSDKTGGDTLGVSQAMLGTEWQRYEIPVTPKVATLDAFVRFYFGYDGDALVHIDDVRLEDAGRACDLAPSELVPNGSFEAGLACWSNVLAGNGAWESVSSDGVQDSAYVTVRSRDASAQSNVLQRTELAVVPGHVYQVEYALRGEGEYRADLALTGNNGASFAFLSEHATSEWNSYATMFWADPAAGPSTDPWILTLVVENAGEGRMDIDNVRVTDLGDAASYCVDNDDTSFELGLACWKHVGPVVGDPIEQRDVDSGASLRFDNPGNTAPADLAVSRTFDVQAGTLYQLTVWAKAASAQPITVIARTATDTLSSDQFTLSSDWDVYFTQVSTPQSPVPVDVEIVVQVGGAAENTVWIDDVVIDFSPR